MYKIGILTYINRYVSVQGIIKA
ncbi:uncharacterized protein FFM5_08051 [Fusarium fujikuroi]|nr:uncharacterized protein FFM5_08051 [Fusarium fujikuroi]